MKVKITIDPDVEKKYNCKSIPELVMIYLHDPNGWAKHGYNFTEVSSNENVLISLSSPKTISKVCGFSNLSCAEVGGNRMYLNADRWFNGSSKSKLPLINYRQYMVSHEMGHILGHKHEKCSHKGYPAPIMMQQTLGIANCSPNTAVQ